jgi:NitT/TauT family transport system substrate-binding protein
LGSFDAAIARSGAPLRRCSLVQEIREAISGDALWTMLLLLRPLIGFAVACQRTLVYRYSCNPICCEGRDQDMNSACAGQISRNWLAFARLFATATAVASAALVALLGSSPGASAQELTSVKISLDYRLYGPNAAFWYAQTSGIFRAAGINASVDNSSGSGDAVARVASGAYDAGYADLGTLTEFWSKNPNVAPKLVIPILDRAAQSVVSLKKANITALRDLVGRKVGTGKADATSRMFPALLKINHIALDSVTRVPVDQQLRDSMLLRGEVDAVVGFDSTTLFNLIPLGIRPEDTNVIYFADNGFDFYGNGFLVSRALIDKNPALVRRLTDAVAKAWVATIADPHKAVEAVGKRDGLTDVAHETNRLRWIVAKNIITPATRAGGLGTIDMGKLANGLKILAEGFELPTVPTAADIYDERFLPPIEHRRFREN